MADRTWDLSEERIELRIINELLHEPGVTVEHAVDSMVSFTAASIAEAARHPQNSQAAGEFCVETRAEALAYEILDKAVSLEPEHQAQLVEFLVQLRSRQMYDPATQKPVQIEGMGLVWTDLPTLQGTVFRRYQDFAYRSDQNPDPRDPKTTTRRQCDEWANLHAFLAQLTRAAAEPEKQQSPSSPPAFAPLYFGHRLADTLASALEGDLGPDHAQAAALARSAAARAACAALVHGGAEALWDRAAGRKTDYVPDVIPLPAHCKITRARWDAWRRGLARLRDVCGADDSNEEMAAQIDRALAEMERVQARG